MAKRMFHLWLCAALALPLDTVATAMAQTPDAGQRSRTEEVPASIGEAWMRPDGTIEMRLRATGPGGVVGHGRAEYRRGDPDYEKVLRHLGGLKPGETKSVPPWPD